MRSLTGNDEPASELERDRNEWRSAAIRDRNAREAAERERDEARAEVERLREDAGPDGWKGKANHFHAALMQAEAQRDEARDKLADMGGEIEQLREELDGARAWWRLRVKKIEAQRDEYQGHARMREKLWNDLMDERDELRETIKNIHDLLYSAKHYAREALAGMEDDQ